MEEEEDEDLYEDNTAQLLEKYADEDDEDEDDFNEGSAINYRYHYESPFDSSRDKDMVIQILVRICLYRKI